MTHLRAVIILLLGATLISSSPGLVKLAAINSLGLTAIGFWRTLIGGLTLLVVVMIRGRSIRLSSGAFRFAFLAGFFFFLDLFFWHRSVIYAGSGMSTVLGNTQVFVAAVLGFILFKERLTPRFMAAAITAFGGVILLVGIGSSGIQFTRQYTIGVIYGLATGFAYASFLIALKKGITDASKPDPMLFLARASLVSALFLGITAAFEGAPFIPTNAYAIASVLGLGVLVQAFGWWVISSALPSVPTGQAGLILLLQPTLSVVWGVLFFAEYLSIVQILGAAITLVAMYVGSIRQSVSAETAKKEAAPY